MTMNAYEAYGFAAQRLHSPTIMSGRHSFQEEAECGIVEDVFAKLHPEPSQRLLEVGCGVGMVLRPLASRVAEAVGVDHPSCLARFEQLGRPPNVTLVPGEWPAVEVQGTFDRILVYSVLHYLSGVEAAKQFVSACIDRLRPGGGLMLGDVPNEDARRRFVTSPFGKEFDAQYARRKGPLSPEHAVRDQIFAQVSHRPPYLNDAFVMGLLADARREGMESYVMPQPAHLAFSFTREDILIWNRA